MKIILMRLLTICCLVMVAASITLAAHGLASNNIPRLITGLICMAVNAVCFLIDLSILEDMEGW